MGKPLSFSEQGYVEAIHHYQIQKRIFLNNLKLINSDTSFQLEKNFLEKVQENYNNDSARQGENIVNQVANWFNSDTELQTIKNSISGQYKRGLIDKKSAIAFSQTYLKKFFEKSIIQKNVLKNLVIPGGAQNDTALLGRIKMLMNQAARHYVLNSSDFVVSQLNGILHEHATIDALKKWFNNFSKIEDLVQVVPKGASGSKTDIDIIFNNSLLNKTVTGNSELNQTFSIQAKNFVWEDLLNSDITPSYQVKVGANNSLKKELLNIKPYWPKLQVLNRKKISAYFLSQGKNVQKSIGENITLYSFSGGKLIFTSDLISQFRQKNLVLSFVDKNDSYIYWVQKNFN